MQTISADSTPKLEIITSHEFTSWLAEQNLSLACTTYQTNRLFFVSTQANGRLKVQERLFDKPMGLYAAGDRLYMSTRYQLWHFDSLLGIGEKYGECDRLYVPRTAYTTGDLNAHEVVLDDTGKVIFVNTDFSCLATLSPDYNFVPLWQPPFISKLVPEDRCHLNGVAMVEGKPKYVTACSATDTAAGWRNCRADGGVVIDIESNEIIVQGLSMPHSPRWYQGKLWLVNSGTGELGYIEGDRFVPITFCPGFVRGLAFWDDFALVGLSKLRSLNFTGLALEKRLEAEGNTAHCGLMVINLTNGEVVHWLHIEQTIEELFDVIVLPNVRQPEALGLQGDDLQRLVKFPGSEGIIITKPTVKRPSIGETPPVAGLPSPNSLLDELPTEQPIPPFSRGARGDQSIRYQRVYHLNTSNILDYDNLTYPRLSQRWLKKPPKGELFGISAAVAGSMVGFVIAERLNAQTAEIISLLVLPEFRRQGIGTKLLGNLEREMRQNQCTQLTIVYELNAAIATTLEPLLAKLGWQFPVMVEKQHKGSWKSLVVTETQSSSPFEPQAPITPALNDVVRQQFAQGKQQAQQGNLEAAISHFQAILNQQPDYIPALNQLGNTLQLLGRFEQAIATYQKIIEINPTVGVAYCNLGSIWQLQNEPEKAISSYQKAIEMQPNLVVAYDNLGKLWASQGSYQLAEQALRQALQLEPTKAQIYLDLGNILRQIGRTQEAIDCFRAAIQRQPDFADAYQNLGGMLMFMNQFAMAQSCCEKVLTLQPNYVLALDNLGCCLEAQGKHREALMIYEQALNLEPDNTKLLYAKEHLLLTLCDWQDYDQRMATLQKRIQVHLQDPNSARISPLFLNNFPFPIELHTAVGNHWSYGISQSMAQLKAHCAFKPSLNPSGKLKIGYLSADFRRHAVGTLIEHLFEYHDRSSVEVYAYSLADTEDEITQNIQQSCDVFVKIPHLSTEAAARRIHEDGIQILIDLAGYTSLCRPDILALQPAPIQIAYLGYPDTTGADFIQYLLADSWLIPSELEQHYTEEIIALPHNFVTTSLSLTSPNTNRKTLGLPEQGFVYACFNRSDKFDPHCFALWMGILQQVSDSVLWLSNG